MKEKKTITENAEKIASDFNSFCWTVIRRSVINQLRGYVRHCRNYGTVSLEETEESLLAVYDDIPAGKIKIPAGKLVILIEDESLADALMGLQDKKREIILLNAAFGYSLSEIAGELDLKYDTVKRYKIKRNEGIAREGREG